MSTLDAQSGTAGEVLPDRGSDRRQQIIDATLVVIAERGVRGTSHRRVASAAGVPVSATSYYFGSLDSLLEAAFSDAIDRDRDAFETRLGKLAPGTDPLPELAAILHELVAQPEKAVLSHELVVAGVRSEPLRRLARQWDANWHGALLPLIGDDLTTSVAVALAVGILEHGLMSLKPRSAGEIEELLRRGLAVSPL